MYWNRIANDVLNFSVVWKYQKCIAISNGLGHKCFNLYIKAWALTHLKGCVFEHICCCRAYGFDLNSLAVHTAVIQVKCFAVINSSQINKWWIHRCFSRTEFSLICVRGIQAPCGPYQQLHHHLQTKHCVCGNFIQPG